MDIISNRIGKYDEFTQAKIVKLFANQVCVVQNIAMKLKAEINHVETSTKKMGYGINMFRNAFHFAKIRIDIRPEPKLELIRVFWFGFIGNRFSTKSNRFCQFRFQFQTWWYVGSCNVLRSATWQFSCGKLDFFGHFSVHLAVKTFKKL